MPQRRRLLVEFARFDARLEVLPGREERVGVLVQAHAVALVALSSLCGTVGGAKGKGRESEGVQ